MIKNLIFSYSRELPLVWIMPKKQHLISVAKVINLDPISNIFLKEQII